MGQSRLTIQRGEIWWIVDDEPAGSEAGFDRPAVIVQSDRLNRSNLNTVLAVPLTGQTARAALETNVFIPKSASGLPHDSVAVTHLVNAINAFRSESAIGCCRSA